MPAPRRKAKRLTPKAADPGLEKRSRFLSDALDTRRRVAAAGLGPDLTPEDIAQLRAAYRVPDGYELPAPARERQQAARP
jgi:hypothetical protein